MVVWGRMRRPFWPAAELGTSSSPHSWKRRTDTAAGPARARAKAGEYRAVLPSKWQCLEERLGSLGQLFTEDCVHCNSEHKPVARCHTHVLLILLDTILILLDYEVLVQDTE